jgi:DNA-binding NarL/FixJ family response regulator
VTGLWLLSPAGDLRLLTLRQLEALSPLVDGCSKREIARELVVAPRTVAAHVRHVLVNLRAPSLTLAAVRAEREGLDVRSARPPAAA